MVGKKMSYVILLALLIFTGNTAFAECPSSDLTGDCFVDLEDFVKIANQWLTGEPNIPDDMVYIPDDGFEMGRHVGYGEADELPLHAVLLDAFFISKFEITNQQYCDYLNSAYPAQLKVVSGVVYASSDDPCDYPYCDTSLSSSYSQIDYSGGVFSVRTKNGRDMSGDPVVEVSWYGAVAYCNWRSSTEGYESCYNLSTWENDPNKDGYRLPTEAEWEYAARGGEQSPFYRFPWGDTISHIQANYFSYWEGGSPSPYYPYDVNPTEGFHPDWDDGIYPYTSPVGSFAPNGYGLYDMAGNVGEWCNDWYDSSYYSTMPYPNVNNPEGPASGGARVLRGGDWGDSFAYGCRVAYRWHKSPVNRDITDGFRIVLVP